MVNDIISLRLWIKQLDLIDSTIHHYYIDNLREWILNLIATFKLSDEHLEELKDMLDTLDCYKVP